MSVARSIYVFDFLNGYLLPLHLVEELTPYGYCHLAWGVWEQDVHVVRIAAMTPHNAPVVLRDGLWDL
tara:strand:+ start:113 stop:316 length:204 start_codon:yes stop_codon:yes gene_type:complete